MFCSMKVVLPQARNYQMLERALGLPSPQTWETVNSWCLSHFVVV
jgi:hypothetical protein